MSLHLCSLQIKMPAACPDRSCSQIVYRSFSWMKSYCDIRMAACVGWKVWPHVYRFWHAFVYSCTWVYATVSAAVPPFDNWKHCDIFCLVGFLRQSNRKRFHISQTHIIGMDLAANYKKSVSCHVANNCCAFKIKEKMKWKVLTTNHGGVITCGSNCFTRAQVNKRQAN